MAQTNQQVLQQILGVCVQINKKIGGDAPKGDGKPGSDKGTAPLSGMINKGVDAKQAKGAAEAIKSIFDSIANFNKVKVNTRKIDATSKALRGLFDTVIYIGKKRKIVTNAMKMFDMLAKSLQTMTKFAKAMTTLLMSVGASILMIAGSLWLAGKMLGTRGAGETLLAITGVLVGLTIVMIMLGKAEKSTRDGTKAAKNMGKAMMYLGAGVLVFVLSWQAVSKVMGMGMGAKALIGGALVIVGVIAAMAGVFALLGLVGGFINKGTKVAVGMAVGMAALALGVLAFVSVARLITDMNSQGDATNKKGEKRGKFGQMMSNIGPGLGMMGIVLVSTALLFAGLGALAFIIIPGVITGILMAGAMALMAMSIKKVVDVSKTIEMDPKNNTVKNMIVFAMGGFLDGVTQVLGGGKKGIRGFAEGIKNTAILMNGIALLMGVSVALSMFAKALTAFASLDNMRVIKSYDEKTGEPVFGETVNIEGVGETIKTTLVSFLTGLIDATTGLSVRQSRAIKKMGRALTGRRGILSAVIQFADVLKTFAQFGPNGEIGFVDMVPDGTDEDGNAKFKQVPSTVKIDQVVENIGSSFSLFVSKLAAMAGEFEFGGREKRKLGRLATALTGRKGILSPIIDFSKALEAYAKYGKDGQIVTYKTDAEGNTLFDENGNPQVLSSTSIDDIAGNIASMLTTFSTALSKAFQGDITDDMSKGQIRRANRRAGKAQKSASKDASKGIERFSKMTSQLGELAAATEGLDKTAKSLMTLATSVSTFADSVNKIELEKLAGIIEIGKENKGVGGMIANIQERHKEIVDRRLDRKDAKLAAKIASKNPEANAGMLNGTTPIIDIDELAMKIGQTVSGAFKNGQFTFDFATDKSGVLNFG